MIYNISFDIAALLFLFIVIVCFLVQKHFRTRSNLVFIVLFVAIFLDIVLDIIGSKLTVPPITADITLLYIINTLYYFVHQAVPALLVLFELTLVDKRVIKYRDYILFMLPGILLELFLIISVPFRLIFSIDAADGFSHEFFYPVIYVGFILYFFINIVAIKKFSSYLPEKVKRTYVALLAITIIAVAIQYFIPEILIGGISLVFVYTLVYLSIQNPEKYIDSVSGAFNRTAFDDYVKESFTTIRRHGLIIDIDGLRKINALYGYKNGNRIIKKIISAISISQKCIFRIDDTKFAFFTKSKKECDFLCEYIKGMDINKFVDEGESALLNLNICVIYDIKEFDDSEKFVRIINEAMSKKELTVYDKNTLELKSEKIDRYIKDIELFEDIKRDLTTGNGFFLKYQPIYDCLKNTFTKAEALLRYQNADFGLVSPLQFVPELERQGSCSDLDELVIKLAFSDISTGNIDTNKLDTININLSATSFMTNKITDTIFSLAEKYSINPENIEFEITETASALLPDVACYNIKRLIDKGFHIALDDFGTGFSNLERMNVLQFSTIKLDRCLLFGEKTIYENIVKTFSNLGYTIVAEGVETSEDLDLARNSEVRYIQGFYYSRPLATEDLKQFLAII